MQLGWSAHHNTMPCWQWEYLLAATKLVKNNMSLTHGKLSVRSLSSNSWATAVFIKDHYLQISSFRYVLWQGSALYKLLPAVTELRPALPTNLLCLWFACITSQLQETDQLIGFNIWILVGNSLPIDKQFTDNLWPPKDIKGSDLPPSNHRLCVTNPQQS